MTPTDKMPSPDTRRQGILLINPPYTDARGPYVAIPQLAAYLKTKSIPVFAADLGAAFMKRLVTPAAIARGAAYVGQRFQTLNDTRELTFAQKIEYQILLRILRDYPAHSGTINWLTTPFADFSDIQDEAEARSYLMLLASMPYFPEIFLSDHHAVNPSRFSPFSTEALLAAAQDNTPYTRMFKEALESAWPAAPLRMAGFSVVFTHQIVPAFQMAAMIRALDPGVHITMGGPSISIFFRQIRNPALFDLVDSLVLDDGEIPLAALYRTLAEPGAPVSGIPGVITLENGRIRHTPPGPPPDLAALPAPDPSVFDLDQYLVPRNKATFPIRIGRGCTWQQCSFCRTGHPLCCEAQELDGHQIFSTLHRLHREHGISRFFFSTESAGPALLEDVSRRILAEKRPLNWMTHTRISRQLTGERCRLFTRAGCTTLAVGIESCCDRILSLMRKGITQGLITRVLEEINGSVRLNAYMMVGFPSETREEALASHEAVADLKHRGLLADFSYSMFVLQQESAIMALPKDFGITAVNRNPTEDLSPDIADFTGTGMTRDQAFALYLDFLKHRIYGSRPPEHLGPVRLNGKTIPIAHDPETLRKAARSQWRSLVVPFGQWMAGQGEQ